MPKNAENSPLACGSIELKEEDILEAIRAIPGHLDITPGDFKEFYRLAFQHALERLSRSVTAAEIMTRTIVTVNPDTPVAEVAAAIGQRGVSGVPVVEAETRWWGSFRKRISYRTWESRNFMSLVAGCLKTKGCVALPIKKTLARDLLRYHTDYQT